MSELIDNRAQRVRALKDIIKHLHSGAPADQVKRPVAADREADRCRQSWRWSRS